MKTQTKSCILTALFGVVFTLQVYGQGTAFTYQGRLSDNGSPANGTYQFQFALFDSASGGNQIGATLANIFAVTSNGLFTVTLNFGANMFTGPSRWLEIGARTNGSAAPFTVLTPRQALLPAPYAILAGTVPGGAINASMLANGSVTAAKIAAGAVNATALANNSVGSAQLADTLELGSSTFDGRLDVFGTTAGTAALRLDGAANSMFLYGEDGSEVGRFTGQSYGLFELRDSDGHQVAARLTANENNGGRLSLFNSNGVGQVLLRGELGGSLTLYNADSSGIGAILEGHDSSGAGRIELYNTNSALRALLLGGPAAGMLTLYQADGRTTATLDGNTTNTGGKLTLYKRGLFGMIPSILAEASEGNAGAGGQILMKNGAGDDTVEIDAQEGPGGGGYIGLSNGGGNTTMTLYASEGGTDGSQIEMKNSRDIRTVEIDAESAVIGGGGFIGLRNASGIRSIVLSADAGTVTTEVIEITGGADFSENFDISGEAHEPGMIVSIDPGSPGRLALSTSAYDKKVAGIISGAGGVRPGMLMGQRGSVAEGKHPVALTGRVYCWIDASANGAVEPGDMLTTSNTAGHGMKATDTARATGAIIGKAMTGLDHGKGLVLVLVNLQ